jgi:hypothetical protein
MSFLTNKFSVSRRGSYLDATESFRNTLKNPSEALKKEGLKKGYSASSAKAYAWHASLWLEHCEKNNIDASGKKQIPEKAIENYLRKIKKDIEEEKVSKSFYNQTCMALKLWYFTRQNKIAKATIESVLKAQEKLLPK